MKKYEIYLPLKYNDGKKIESEKLIEIQQQLMAVFGGITISSMSAPYAGTLRRAGVEFNDNISNRNNYDRVTGFTSLL